MRLLSSILAMLVASTLGANAAVFILQTPVAQTGASATVTTDGTPESYVGGGSAIILENTLAITCACSTLDSATVTISSGAFTGDLLAAPTQVGITNTFTSNTLTLTGTAAISTYLQVLQNVTYSSSNADPTNSGGNLTRTITWNVVNASNASNSPTTTVNVTAGVPAPTLTPSGSVSTFTSGGAAAALDGGITLTCSCTNLTSATLTIAAGLLTGDALNVVTPGSLSQAYDSGAGVLTLTGTATLAVYQTAFRSITYASTLQDPTNSGADPIRTITWAAVNSTSSGSTTTTVNVQNPSVPTINLGPNNSVNYTAGGSPLVVNGGLNMSCSCVNFTSATLSLSTGFFTGDILAATSSLGISAVYNSGTGVMTFTGTTTVANYQTLLRTITYSSSSGDPSNGGLNPTRTATWVVFNGANASAPVTTMVEVFIAGQPSWVLTGAQAAINPATNQAWVNGLGTGPLSAEITVTRASTETCYGGNAPNYVTFAAPNTACATPRGMAVWPTYTNYIPSSFDPSNATNWITYCGAAGACPSGGSVVTVTGNSVLDPTGVTSGASKVAVTRTATGNYATVQTNQITGPAQIYSAGIWLQADASDPGSIGKVIQFGFLSSAGYGVHNIILPATWTWFPYYSVANVGAGCNSGTQSCQFQVGLTNQPGSGGGTTGPDTTLTATFDVWGAELNGGVYAFPTAQTGVSRTATNQADNISITPGSALETALVGPASSVIMNTNLGIQGVASTVLDSNGVTWLGESSGNFLTTAIALPASTVNTGVWNTPALEGYTRDGSGRSMALNGSIIYKDSQGTVIGSPLYLGATLGSSSFFTGYLGTMNAFNTRIADSQIGVTGVGTDYYFAAAGNDSNACTIGSPCLSITKANTIPMVTNDTMRFNGGDTFIGCLNVTGGSNWNATRAAPATIESYGTGQATLTGNCTAGNAKVGIINLTSADGVIVSNLNFVGDTAGNANRGVSLKNCDSTKAHGNVTIQNNTFTGIHDGTASNNDYGAAIFTDGSCNNAAFQYDHISLLNNTDSGATTSATDNSFLNSYGYKCSQQYDIIQGNLIFNLGGDSAGVASAEGTGILIAACGLGSSNSVGANGLTSAIVQFNVVHNNAANNNGCGAVYGIWSNEADAVIIRANEVYSFGIGSTAGCDKGGYDLDGGGGNFATNSIVERNYSHGNFGPTMLFFGGNNNTGRWNIGDGDGVAFTFHGHSLEETGSPLMFFYNNVLADSTGAQAIMSFTGCPAAGSLMANNIFISRSTSGTQFFFNMGAGSGGVHPCLPPPTGGLTFTHNDWWATGSGPLRWWIDNQGSVGTATGSISGTTMTVASMTGTTKVGMMITGTGIPASTYITACSNVSSGNCINGANTFTLSKSATTGSQTDNTTASAATFANAELLLNETGGLNVDPLFVSPYAQTTCGNTTGGPQAGNCPSGMHLQGGSSLHAPAGAVLTSQPFNLPANNGGTTGSPTNSQGTKDYWGNTLPCPTVGGFPIGAEC